MMNYIKQISTIIFSSIILIGCSSTRNLNKLSSDVQNLDNKIERINNDIEIIRSDMQFAKEDAARANKRLDNQVSSYRK